ncbi:MAG: TatD family hydrolase [Eubacterium sp.]|nr:TatD family hydrolase [Eubacterium sp.]
MIFETHAHYDDDRYDEDRDEILSGMEANGVGYIVNIGSDMEANKITLELVDKYPFMYGALGVHPDEVYDLTDADYEWIESHINDNKIVAVGEIGLDYYREYDKDAQFKALTRQLDIARRHNKPIVVHSRDAAQDTYEILKAENAGELGGVVHCFSYPIEMAEKFVDMGFYIGIGGVITFKNSKKLQEVAEILPIEKIVLETDCPYLSPEPFRGERNDSTRIKYVAEKIAEIKNMDVSQVIDITEQNAKDMYGISSIA